MKRSPCLLQMTKGNVGSLLVFDPEKISFEDQSAIKSATSDAVVGIVTERGGSAHARPYTSMAVKANLARRGWVHPAVSERPTCGLGRVSMVFWPMPPSNPVVCTLPPAEASWLALTWIHGCQPDCLINVAVAAEPSIFSSSLIVMRCSTVTLLKKQQLPTTCPVLLQQPAQIH